MIMGFSGTKTGMTEYQKEQVRLALRQYQPTEVHHGDCIGADAEFHALVRAHTQAKIVIHPATDGSRRAFCVGDQYWPPTAYLLRNNDIARICTLLLATPKESHEVGRSGTWATIRYARRYDKTVVVIAPVERR